jgi:hypothetical protein
VGERSLSTVLHGRQPYQLCDTERSHHTIRPALNLEREAGGLCRPKTAPSQTKLSQTEPVGNGLWILG